MEHFLLKVGNARHLQTVSIKKMEIKIFQEENLQIDFWS